MKKILILGINFHPEAIGIGKYSGELAAYLLASGHNVRIVTAPPYYPEWKIQPGYAAWHYKLEFWNGGEVVRCPTWVPRKPTGLKRLAHLLSFALSSFPIMLRQLSWKPDIIICIAPAFFCAPFALLTAYLCRAKSWLHIQDFELDAAINLGLLPANNLFTKLARFGENWILKRFSRVSTISDGMFFSLIQKGVAQHRAYLFPNWVDTSVIFPLPPNDETIKQDLGIPKGSLVILYSGNMGQKQGLEIVIEAARRLQFQRSLLFIFCGEGAARIGLETMAQNLENVRFIPLQPVEKLNQLLNMADIHILPQRSDVADLVMPSKLLGMLSSGKAVIGTANPGTDVYKVLNQVGVVVNPGDLNSLCNAIIDLTEAPGKRKEMGAKGRAYVSEFWGKQQILSNFEAALKSLVESEGA